MDTHRTSARRRTSPLRLAALLAALLLVLGLFVSCRRAEDDPLRLYFLDVGQGSAVLLRTDGGDFLIDAGTESSQELLCARLDELGVERLRLAIFTHGDEDHIGGADRLLESVAVEEIWFNGSADDNEASMRLYRRAASAGIPVRAVRLGEHFSFGNLHLRVLSPIVSSTAEGNEGSIVIKLSFGEFDALFTGDVGAETEAQLLKTLSPAHVDCELYHVGHHGSYTSTSAAFLDAMSPECAVISCGVGNPYGHPHGEVLERLEASGARILRTDLVGEILISTDGEEIRYWN